MEIFILLVVLISQDPALNEPVDPVITWDIEVAPNLESVTPARNWCSVYA